MLESEIQPGIKFSSQNRMDQGVITRVTRSRWRHTLLRFWVLWNDQLREAEHMPGDAQYLIKEGEGQ